MQRDYNKPWPGVTGRIARTARAVLALELALVLAAPLAAHAVVLPKDTLGDVEVSTSATLRSVAPDVSMASGLVVTSDGRVLWARRPEARRAIASITKVMTAIVVLERLSPDDALTVDKDAAAVGESEARLQVGEELTVREALAAMLVKSANDAALALAIRAAGTEKAFVALMNAKAGELGMTGTRFANSHGLDEPGHYSSAEDVAIMCRVAMTNPEFRDVVRRRSVVIGTGSAARRLDSSNLLLKQYRGANGLKTGWTSGAGYCLAASAMRADIELVAVVLGTKTERSRFVEAERLLDWGFEHYRSTRVAVSGSVVGTLTVADYLDRTVLAVVSRDESSTLFDLDGAVKRKVLVGSTVRAPIARGRVLGTLRVTQGGRLLANVPLVADRDVAAPGFFERISIAVRRLWRRIFG